jgi:hypothetical protein
MAELGERLVDNGYPVIPIMPGAKVPGRLAGGAWSPYPDWARHCDRPTKAFELDIWRRWPGCGVGIAAGAVVGVDIDVLDAPLAIDLARLATEMLGDTPCLRIGQAPKRLLVYRAAAPFAGRKRHPVELLARGQQFVAHALHPGTGRPYEWPEDSLLDVPLARLPAVDEARCAAFLDAAWRALPEEARATSLLPTAAAIAPASAWRGPSDPKGTREAIAALAYLPNDDLPGNEWITVGAAIKAALGEHGRDLWLDWSRRSGKSGRSGRKDTPERRWASLRPHSVGAGTIYWLAEQRGWVPDPALTLSGAAEERAARPHPAAGLLARWKACRHRRPNPHRPNDRAPTACRPSCWRWTGRCGCSWTTPPPPRSARSPSWPSAPPSAWSARWRVGATARRPTCGATSTPSASPTAAPARTTPAAAPSGRSTPPGWSATWAARSSPPRPGCSPRSASTRRGCSRWTSSASS